MAMALKRRHKKNFLEEQQYNKAPLCYVDSESHIRRWPNTLMLLFLLGLSVCSTVVAETGSDGPGLYKDGQKVIDLQEMTTTSALSPSMAPAQKSSKGEAFRDQVLGGQDPSRFEDQKAYFMLVLRCHDLIRQSSIESGGSPVSRDVIDGLLALEPDLASANEALQEKFKRIEVSLRDNGYPPEKLKRHQEVVRRHDLTSDRLLELLSDLRQADASGDQAALNHVLQEFHQYFSDNVFIQERSLVDIPPAPMKMELIHSPIIELGASDVLVERMYPMRSERGPDPADLAPTIDVQFTDDIVDLAAELSHSPVEIYDYVRDNFEFEPYLGSRKGSQQTLNHRRGNDYDQASLLIALLRVSGIPARYAVGDTVMMPIDRATNWLGISDPTNAGAILTTCDMQGILYYMNSVPYAISCKRVWVEAWLPFINYRGAINDSIGFMWVPMDPTFKQYTYEPGVNLPAEMGFDAEAFVWDYILSGLQPETPVDVFKQMLIDSLAVYYPGYTYEDLITRRSVIKETDGIIPGTLPYEVIQYGGSFSEIPSNMRYQIEFELTYTGGGLTYSTTLPEIVEKQVTISYVGATPADQEIIDTAGGIFNVTIPYLVDLQPVLKIDGCEVATGTGAITLGVVHNSIMHFTAPTGAQNQMPLVSNAIIAGNYQGIGIDTEDAFPALFGEPETACEETRLGFEQHQLALTYLNEVDKADDVIADLMHLVVLNDVSEAIVENSVSVTYGGSLDDPQTIDWTGMTVDADRKIVGPFSVDGEANACDFMRLGGADGSIQENKLFEDRFEEEAISAVKILEIAADSGITVCEITYNIDVECPGFDHDPSVRTAVQNAINIGHYVIIPQRSFKYGEWTGTGYIDIDPVTCAAGYIISGGHDGGATVWVWVDPWYLWFWGTKCRGAFGNVLVAPGSSDDWYCSSNWAMWVFMVPTTEYYNQNAAGDCYVWWTETNLAYLVPWPIAMIATIWGPGEYEFTAGGNGSPCSGCTSVNKTVGIASIVASHDAVSICKDAHKILVVSVSPSNAPVTFESLDPSIAVASWSQPHLTITGKKAGATSVIAKIGGQQCGSSVGVSVAEVQFPTEEFWVCTGNSKAMDITGVPSGTAIEYKSDDESVATAAGGTSDVTVQGKLAGSTTIRAFVNGEECGSKDVSVIELAIDGLVNGDAGLKIADMQDRSDPANVVASSYVKFQARVGSGGIPGGAYYKWSVSGGSFTTTSEGNGDTYLEVKWEAPSSHQQTISLMFEVKESAGGPTVCSETVQLRTVRPYVVQVRFVDHTGNDEQDIHGNTDPEFSTTRGNNCPICYVGGHKMKVQVDLAGDKGDDDVNLLAKATPIRVTATAVYGGISNPFTEDEAVTSTGHWAVPDWVEVEIESSNNLPALVREYEDFEMHWTFKVKSSSGTWVTVYQEESGYSQKTVHVQTEGSKKYGLYLVHDAHKYVNAVNFKKLTLDFACKWADGEATPSGILSALLVKGFNVKYKYTSGGNCLYLAKDFAHLSKTLGIAADIHRWNASSSYAALDNMIRMYPNEFDPQGDMDWDDFQDHFGNGWNAVRDGWWYHAFVEANGTIYDPSARTSQVGSWGTYEDSCFEKYSFVSSLSPLSVIWTPNQPGQSVGCEAPPHAVHLAITPESVLGFTGPPRGY